VTHSPMSEEPLGSTSLWERMAETPRPVARPGNPGRVRRSVQVALLLILKEEGKLSEGQIRTLIRIQSTLREEELSRVEELYRKLRSSPRSYARSRKDFEEVLLRTSSTPPKSKLLPEGRRIGVGYRDKGALRPSHRPRAVAPRMWWSEDIRILHQYYCPGEDPRWITSEELHGWRQRDHNFFEELSAAMLRLCSIELMAPRSTQPGTSPRDP
jgi:hypothetical protein